MILVIDNYDSFTYNLVHYLNELGAETEVVRNDQISVQDALALRPEAILLSLPPVVNWRYNWQPEEGSAEAMLYRDFLRPRDWLASR